MKNKINYWAILVFYIIAVLCRYLTNKAGILDNIGNTFSAKNISDFLKSQGRKLSRETVYNYLKALENAY